MDHTFLKENFEDRVKLLGSNVLNFCLKITKTNLRKRGLKMRDDVSKNFAPPSAGFSLSAGSWLKNRLLGGLSRLLFGEIE